jgi:hypothetical protein
MKLLPPLALLAMALFIQLSLPLNAQETSPTPNLSQELHLLIAKVEDRGVLCDQMEPEENPTVRHMKAIGSPLAGGMVPAGVSSKGLASAMEPIWHPSGRLIFVKGNFPGIAEGDRQTVKAIRIGVCKITSQTDGEVRQIALWEAL